MYGIGSCDFIINNRECYVYLTVNVYTIDE